MKEGFPGLLVDVRSTDGKLSLDVRGPTSLLVASYAVVAIESRSRLVGALVTGVSPLLPDIPGRFTPALPDADPEMSSF